jgi:hemolysin activation/secretion protein
MRAAGAGVLRALLLFAACGGASWAQPAVPPAVPPAATLGGAQPRLPEAEFPAGRFAEFPIPRVPDRPLGLDEGPRLRVSRFELIGAATQPDVPAAEVDAVLTSAVAAQPAEGYTVNQLQEVANRVAGVYRNHGLILAQAVVPAQDVLGGVVNVMVLEGALGQVRFEGHEMYSERTLARPFRSLLGRPVHNADMESALLYMTEYPGLSAFGMFQAGARIGTTDLVVRTQREDRFAVDTTLDNEGSQFSGQYRATVGFTVNDPLGQADQLKAYLLDAFDPADGDARGLYGGVDYRLPLAGPKQQLQVGYSRNLFDVGERLRELGIEGTTDIAQAAYLRSLSKTRLGEDSLELSLARKDAEFEQQGVTTAHDVLSVGGLGYHREHIGVRSRGVTQLSAAYRHGFDGLFGSLTSYDRQEGARASRLGAGGRFDQVTADVQRFQRITRNHALLLRASAQYSEDVLVSLEQFSMGGPDTVRAYPAAEFLADRGRFLSVEWVMNAPGFAARPAFSGRTWGQIFQVSFFVDHAAGRLTEALPGESDHAALSGAGFAVQLNVPGRVFARLDVARPLGDEEPTNGRDPQFFFRFGFTR